MHSSGSSVEGIERASRVTLSNISVIKLCLALGCVGCVCNTVIGVHSERWWFFGCGVGLDKKFFKEVKQLTEKIEGRLVLATPSARTQASQAIKYLDHIVKLVKAYKAVVIRSSSSRQS